MLDTIKKPVGNPGRGGHRVSQHAGQVTGRLREAVAKRINAPAPERICLSSGSTESLNAAILGLLWFHPKPHAQQPVVVTTVLEHNAVRRPLKHLQRDGVCQVVEIGCNKEGFVDAQQIIEAASQPGCVAVAMTACSNVVGTAQPIETIGQGLRAQAPEVLFLVDGAQAMGALPLDVQAFGIDILAFSGHKAMLGPPGTGGMYLSDRAYTTDDGGEGSEGSAGSGGGGGPIRPSRFGGTGGTLKGSVEDFMPPEMPGAFEVGTQNIVGRTGLLAALEDPAVPSQADALAHERELIGLFLERFADDPHVKILGPAGTDRRHGVVSFTIEGYSPQEVSSLLDSEWGIAIRAGLHCAPSAHRAMGTIKTGGCVRASPGPFSTAEEMQTLIRAVEQLVG